jgi:hypothetical protein
VYALYIPPTNYLSDEMKEVVVTEGFNVTQSNLSETQPKFHGNFFILRRLYFFTSAAKLLNTKHWVTAGRHKSDWRKKPGETMGRKQG